MLRRSLPLLGGAAIALLLLAVPYVVAYRQPEGFVFGGFLVNPVDGFSYLAKMRQGYNGAWLFKLPYTDQPGAGSAIYLYYLLLGHLQRWLALPAVVAYHLARLVGAALMLAAARAFVRSFLGDPGPRRWAMGLVVFGSGLGWFGLVLGRLPVDLWVPEAIPFFSGFANAHFALASAMLLVSIAAIAAPDVQGWSRSLAAIVAGFILAIVQPFGTVTVAVVAGVWLVWLRWKPLSGEAAESPWGEHARTLGLFLLVSGPVLAYDFWVARTNPAVAGWTAQNVTPTPPLLDVGLGLGIPLVLASLGARVARAHESRTGRLLVAWLVAGLLLVFLPVPLQRRMLLGIFFPICALAGIALEKTAAGGSPIHRLLALALFALCLPTNVLLIVGTVGGASRQEPDVVLTQAEVRSYQWIDAHLPRDSLVLTGETTGNRLPAFASVRVLYGHPFETPNAARELAYVDGLFSSPESGDVVGTSLQERSVDYVLVGERERGAGPLLWLAELRPVYEQGGVSIYQVPPP